MNLSLYSDEKKALQLLISVARLKRESEDFQRFVDYLERLQVQTDIVTRSAVEPKLQWSQGEAQMLAKLLHLIAHAEEQRDKAKTNREREENPRKENAF